MRVVICNRSKFPYSAVEYSREGRNTPTPLGVCTCLAKPSLHSPWLLLQRSWRCQYFILWVLSRWGNLNTVPQWCGCNCVLALPLSTPFCLMRLKLCQRTKHRTHTQHKIVSYTISVQVILVQVTLTVVSCCKVRTCCEFYPVLEITPLPHPSGERHRTQHTNQQYCVSHPPVHNTLALNHTSPSAQYTSKDVSDAHLSLRQTRRLLVQWVWLHNHLLQLMGGVTVDPVLLQWDVTGMTMRMMIRRKRRWHDSLREHREVWFPSSESGPSPWTQRMGEIWPCPVWTAVSSGLDGAAARSQSICQHVCWCR